MPQNIALAAFVLGAVLLLLALSAGSFKFLGAEMSGAAGRWSRVVAGVIGVGLIAFALLQYSAGLGPTRGAPADESASLAGEPGTARVANPARGQTATPAGAATTGPATTAAIEDSTPPPRRPVMGPLEMGINRQGNDFDAFGKSAENAQLCAEMCRTTDDCKAMTYVVSAKTCWMKTVAPPAASHPDMISSVKVIEEN